MVKICYNFGQFSNDVDTLACLFYITYAIFIIFTILKDPLKIKNKPKSNWVKRKKIINISEYLRQQ